MAVKWKQVDIARSLIQVGASINVKIKQHNDSLEFYPIHDAVGNNDIETVRMLLDHEAFVDVVDSNGMTPLHYVAGVKPRDSDELLTKMQIADMLLNHGAYPDIQCHEMNTPMHMAAFNNQFQIMEILSKHNALCNLKNQWNETPLDLTKYPEIFNAVTN